MSYIYTIATCSAQQKTQITISTIKVMGDTKYERIFRAYFDPTGFGQYIMAAFLEPFYPSYCVYT